MQRKNTERKALGPKVTPQVFEFFDSTWEKPNTGATYILDAMPGLHRQTIKELYGMFSQNELFLMVDAMNGCMLTAQIAGNHLISNVADAIELDFLDKKWKIGKMDILRKLQDLTVFQTACLELWIQSFWHQHREIPLEDYVKTLTD